MRKKLNELNALATRAKSAHLLDRAALAMIAIDTAAALLAELIDTVEHQRQEIETLKGGRDGLGS